MFDIVKKLLLIGQEPCWEAGHLVTRIPQGSFEKRNKRSGACLWSADFSISDSCPGNSIERRDFSSLNAEEKSPGQKHQDRRVVRLFYFFCFCRVENTQGKKGKSE